MLFSLLPELDRILKGEAKSKLSPCAHEKWSSREFMSLSRKEQHKSKDVPGGFRLLIQKPSKRHCNS